MPLTPPFSELFGLRIGTVYIRHFLQSEAVATCEFEEREYEAPLYTQLQHRPTQVWAPGQVFEAHVGFDYAMFAEHPYFWKLQGFSTYPLGVVLGSHPPGFWFERKFRRPLPDFSLNLFIQAKRPVVLSRVSAKLKAEGLNGPYWKLTLTPHQQLLLESLASAAGNSALVCYAGPAFHRFTELYAHIRQGTVVEHSTFPPALSLKGHEAWNYTAPGATGVANSSPERVEEAPLLERLREFTQRQRPREAQGFAQNMKRLALVVIEAARRGPENGRSAIYFQTLQEIDRFIDVYQPQRYPEVLRNYLVVATFASTFGLSWHVLSGEG